MVICSLNCPEEVYLSEKLLKQYCFDMVRYKDGGEANSIAIRIVRAHTKRVRCNLWLSGGMIGIYLKFIIKNLQIIYCPDCLPWGAKEIDQYCFSFEYNDINFIKFVKNNIGAVKMEVFIASKNNF